jgi:thiazole/oxazole-forming peptide maturase SagD family component
MTTGGERMQINVASMDAELRLATARLLDRIVSPLCGINQGIGFIRRGRGDPRFAVAGAELTGVHYLLGQREAGSYHIGGGGVTVEEAVIRTLAESLERYGQLVAASAGGHDIRFTTQRELAEDGERVVHPSQLSFFADEMFAAPDFPFQPFSADSPMGWVCARSALDHGTYWVPAQLAFVGYIVKSDAGERRIGAGVTTGTAAHTSRITARRNALLELIQIDAVMGHWYTDRVAPEIVHDANSVPLQHLIGEFFPHGFPDPRFYWLPTAETSVCVVACAIRKAEGALPSVSIGLGADYSAVRAMYKALVEAVGVMQLAKVGLVNETLERWRISDVEQKQTGTDQALILDLDSNVTHYAAGSDRHFVDRKFGGGRAVNVSQLPDQVGLRDDDQVADMLDALAKGSVQIVELDLTTPDVAAVGFNVARMWSPDLLSLCLPSCPPKRHKAFARFGGATHSRPHPYP